METNKVNTGTGTKRVSLPSGTFRIFAKSVRDVTTNKLKKDRSGSTSTTSSSNESSPNKDGGSPLSEGKTSPGMKMSEDHEISEKRKTPESLSPLKSHSPAKINRMDSPEKPSKSRRSIVIEIDNLKENYPAPDIENEESLGLSKNGGNRMTGMVDELMMQNNVCKPDISMEVKNDEPKSTKGTGNDKDAKSKNNPPDKQHFDKKPLIPYNRHRRSSYNDSFNHDQYHHHKPNRHPNPDHYQPRRHSSNNDMDHRTHGRPYQRFDNDWRPRPPYRNPPPRIRVNRSSGAGEVNSENKSEDRDQEDWNNDLLVVKDKVGDNKLAKGLSTSLPGEKTPGDSSVALNSSCPELDQDTKVPISSSDIDHLKEIIDTDLQDNMNCSLSQIHLNHSGQSHLESGIRESEKNFDHEHKPAGPKTKEKSNELSNKIDKSLLNISESAKNLVKNDKDYAEDPNVDVKTPKINMDNFMSKSDNSGVNTPDAVGSTIVQASSEKKIFKDNDAVENTEDWSNELTEVTTPEKDVKEVQNGMIEILHQQHSPSDKNNDSKKSSDTGTGSVCDQCISDRQDASGSKLESEVNWAEGWTHSIVETSSADVTGISLQGAIQNISNSNDAGEIADLLPETCMSYTSEKSVLSTDNRAVGLSRVENNDLNSKTEDVLPNTNSNHHIVSLQDGVPRMKAIFARGGIRPSHSSRGAHSFIHTERSTITSDKDIIKPHPLMSIELEGNWEKVLENDAEEPDEEEMFDSEVKTPKNVDQPLPVAEPLKDPNNNIEEGAEVVPGNVAPQYSQDIRRKSSSKEDQKQIGSSPNQNVQLLNVSRRSSFENTETVKHSRPHVPRRNTQTPPLRTRNDESLDAELKKIDDYLGLTKHPKRPEHHASSHKKHVQPRTHSFSESSRKNEKRGSKTEKSFKSDKSNKSEDWSSELLDVHSEPVKPQHITEKLYDTTSNSIQNVSKYSNNSDTIPIPDNSLMDINANYSPNCSTDNQIKMISPKRSYINEKLPSPQKNCSKHTREQSKGIRPDRDLIEITKYKNDKNYVMPNVKNESVQSSKEFSIERDISGDKHGILTSSKMSTSNNGVAISDAFSDFSSVGSDDDILKQSDSISDPPKKLTPKSSISKKSKHHYRYSSQDMSISETISSMSTDQRCQSVQKAEVNDMDYRCKPPMPPNPLEYPYYHQGKPVPGPPFDPRLFNPYIPFYPPYIYPPYYPGYDSTLLEQHQKIEEERRHIKQEKEEIKPKKNPDTIKKESKYADQNYPIPNLSHLITVPLNKITDLEQAQLLLQFVDQLVRKVPHASGAYYRAVSNQGEPSLEVGATTEPSTQNKNKTKSPVNHYPTSHQHERRRPPVTSDMSSVNHQYQYQPRYPPPQFDPTEDPQFPHQDLPSHIFQYHDAALKTSEDNRYHDLRHYYMNENQMNMDNLREPDSPNPSLVSYEITDDDDYYEETDKNVRKVLCPQDPLNDRRNIICNKLIEDSLGQKPLDHYHQEFPELGKNFKGPKRSVSDTDASIRKVIDRDISAKETFEQKPTNIRYVPPHKRRFSEYGESRSMTKFGALNTFEEENRNPYEVWQKYLKSSPTDQNKNTASSQTNYLRNNWREKADPVESYASKFSNVPPSYVQENQRRRYSSGQIPESLVNDAKLYRDPYRPYSDSRQYDCSTGTPASSMDSISSRSSYTSRLLNDNRLNNDATPSRSFNQMWKIRFKDRSKIYQVPFIDSHCHLDLLYERLNFNGTYKEFLQRYSDCYPSNFAGCIAIFCYPRNFELNGLWKKLAEEDHVWISMGCHPKNAKQYNEMVEENMLKILKHPKVVAVGEIGLDYSSGHKQFESLQKTVLRRQLKIALDVKKPIVIHCRDAEDDCLQIMEEIIPKNYKIQCHCFSGNYSQAQRWLSAFPNLYLGLTPVVTFSGAHAAHDVARNIPLNRLLLETDSPYFVPRPLQKEEQVISFPGFALTVAEDVAHRRGIAVQEVLRHCRENMTSLFGI